MHDPARREEIRRDDRNVRSAWRVPKRPAHARGSDGVDYRQRLKLRLIIRLGDDSLREIIFYKTDSGKSPVEEFLDSLTGKQAQKAAWVLRLIEELDSVPIQYFKKLTGTDDIWEVRIQIGGDIIRLLGFFYGSGLS